MCLVACANEINNSSKRDNSDYTAVNKTYKTTKDFFEHMHACKRTDDINSFLFNPIINNMLDIMNMQKCFNSQQKN